MKHLLQRIVDLYMYYVKGYKHKYYDGNNRNIIYSNRYRSEATKLLDKVKIIDSLGHLKFFFQFNLKTGKLKSIQTKTYIRDMKSKVTKEDFIKALCEWEDTDHHNKVIQKFFTGLIK